MLVAGAALRLLVGGSAFDLAQVDKPTLRWTSADAILASVQVPLGTNVFAIQTAPIEARLLTLPAVAAAHVSVGLPDVLSVSIDERVPILAWRVGATSYLVDSAGVLFATVDAAGVTAAGVPTVVDSRVTSPAALGVGIPLDPVDLDVATRLGALHPADVGSTATRLQVLVDDTDGYVVTGGTGSWTAVFGFYNTTVRPADLIPSQVRLLRSLLADRESAVARVYLAGAQSGTYVPKPTHR